MYLTRGALPWQGLKAPNSKERFQKIGEMKRNTPIGKLCEGQPGKNHSNLTLKSEMSACQIKIFSLEIAEYLQYVRHLEFYETPDYAYLTNIFINALKSKGLVDDRQFDWLEKLVVCICFFYNLF